MSRPADRQAQLSAYLDGELSEEESAGIRIVLMNDERLRTRLEELKELDRLLTVWDRHDMVDIRASDTYESRLLKRMRGLHLKSRLSGSTTSRLSSF